MHLINQVHLVTPRCWRIRHVLKQFAGFLYFGARGGINFDQIEEAPGFDVFTGRTLATGFSGDVFGAFAVQTFGKNSRNRGFANTAHAREQISMVQPIGVERVG